MNEPYDKWPECEPIDYEELDLRDHYESERGESEREDCRSQSFRANTGINKDGEPGHGRPFIERTNNQ